MNLSALAVSERIKLFDRYWAAPAALCLLLEALVIFGSVWIASVIRFSRPDRFPFTNAELNLGAGIVTLVVLLSLYLQGLYDFKEHRSRRQEFVLICRALVGSIICLSAFYFFAPSLWMGRTVLVISGGLTGVSIFGSRLLVTPRLRDGMFSERVLMVGGDCAALEIGREILSRRHLGYQLVGYVSDDPLPEDCGDIAALRLGVTADAYERATALGATRVVVAVGDRRGKLSLDGLLDCKIAGIAVEGSSSYYEQLTGKVLLDGPRVKSWLVFNDGFTIAPLTLLVKRLIDVGVAAVALTLVAPLMLITAVAVKLDSPGSVLYRQRRVGRGSREFRIVKFRSMIDDAERDTGPLWADNGDTRVTRVGRVLRRSRIDELPQLWNVLAGDMSLVGPRPERPEFVADLRRKCKLYEKRLAVRPGITGWAQIMAPYAASVEDSKEKLRFDLYYIKHLCTFLDLSILASTVRAALLGRGAR